MSGQSRRRATVSSNERPSNLDSAIASGLNANLPNLRRPERRTRRASQEAIPSHLSRSFTGNTSTLPGSSSDADADLVDRAVVSGLRGIRGLAGGVPRQNSVHFRPGETEDCQSESGCESTMAGTVGSCEVIDLRSSMELTDFHNSSLVSLSDNISLESGTGPKPARGLFMTRGGYKGGLLPAIPRPKHWARSSGSDKEGGDNAGPGAGAGPGAAAGDGGDGNGTEDDEDSYKAVMTLMMEEGAKLGRRIRDRNIDGSYVLSDDDSSSGGSSKLWDEMESKSIASNASFTTGGSRSRISSGHSSSMSSFSRAHRLRQKRRRVLARKCAEFAFVMVALAAFSAAGMAVVYFVPATGNMLPDNSWLNDWFVNQRNRDNAGEDDSKRRLPQDNIVSSSSAIKPQDNYDKENLEEKQRTERAYTYLMKERHHEREKRLSSRRKAYPEELDHVQQEEEQWFYTKDFHHMFPAAQDGNPSQQQASSKFDEEGYYYNDLQYTFQEQDPQEYQQEYPIDHQDPQMLQDYIDGQGDNNNGQWIY
mmetsp:Transcript_27120/g.57240  ORF Transcript_27120/g.57240 Transcript_27120/m.57240 type:complete len:535 (-) Transcript_27120:107-1711(-)